MREFSIPASVRVDDGDTLPGEVFDLAEEFPDTVAVRRRIDGTWADLTYAAFVAEIVDVARGLIASGVAPGDRVALLSRTRYEWTLLDYAIGAVGAVTVPIYETSSPDQVAQHEQGVRAVTGPAQRLGVAVDVRDDVHPHDRPW